MNKIAIIIQGASTNVQDQKKAWGNYLEDCFFSTWIGEESYYEKSDNVIFNSKPQDPGPMNFNYQMESTLSGLLCAKERGYTRALKIRSDLVPSNVNNFLQDINNDSFNFLCWHHHQVYPNCPGYLVDYLMSGPIDGLINLWNVDSIFCTVPEVLLTWNYIQKCSNVDIEYFLHKLNINNTLHWIKHDLNLMTYQKHGIYDQYDKYTFSDKIDYLNENYLKFLK